MYVVFNPNRRIARGTLREAAIAAHAHRHEAGVVIFDETSFSVIDVDLSGSADEVGRRIDSYPKTTAAPASDPFAAPAAPFATMGLTKPTTRLLPAN